MATGSSREIDLETSPDNTDDEEYTSNNPMEAIIQYREIYARNQELLYSKRGGMWALAVESLGAALRLLAPAALISLICGHDSFLIRLLQQCDKAVRAILYPTPDQTDSILKWLQESLPGDQRTKSLDGVWEDGAVLCALVESVVPGSCSGHGEEERTDLSHGQRLAEQYLGVTPIFSQEELSQKVLNTYQECRLTHYLGCIKEAIGRMSPAVSRTGSPLLNIQAYTLDYVARGMGLVTAYKNRKATFYLYPTAQQGIEPGDISVQIKGPGNSYGSTIVPVIFGRAHIIRNVFLNLGHRQNFNTQLPLPMVQGFQSSGFTKMYDKTITENNYFVPKLINDIDVSIVTRQDRVKVNYIPKIPGHHELSLISKGCHIIGSPFTFNVEIESMEREKSIDYLDEDVVVEESSKPERKVVFRIVDFVTEKMLLTEDGRLEKITEEEANALMHTTESLEDLTFKCLQYSKRASILPGPDLIEYKRIKIENELRQSNIISKLYFKEKIQQVILMLRVCKALQELCKLHSKRLSENYLISAKDMCSINYTAPPDIVNSTNRSAVGNKNKSDEISRESPIDRPKSAEDRRKGYMNKISSFNNTTDTQDIKNVTSNPFDININDVSCDQMDIQTILEDSLNSDWKTKETFYTAPIEIIVSSFDDDDNEVLLKISDTPPTTCSPIPEEYVVRPKTPVYKILDKCEEEIFDEFEHYKLDNKILDSLDVPGDESYDPMTDEDLQGNFPLPEERYHRSMSPSINFHIGAPVTPTMMNVPPLETDMDSIILASNLDEALEKLDVKIQKCVIDGNQYNSEESMSSVFATPLRLTPFEQMTDSQILRMYEEPLTSDEQNNDQASGQFKSLDANENSLHDFNVEEESVSIASNINEALNLPLTKQDSRVSNENIERHSLNDVQNSSMETWDSAYMSIDEVNSSPDTNSHTPRSNLSTPREKLVCIEETDSECMYSVKSNVIPIMDSDMLAKMGPAEREIWNTIQNNGIVIDDNNHRKVIETNLITDVVKSDFQLNGEIKNELCNTIDANKCDVTNVRLNDHVRVEEHKLYTIISSEKFTKKSSHTNFDNLCMKKEHLKKEESLQKEKSPNKDGSASDCNADVKRSGEEKKIRDRNVKERLMSNKNQNVISSVQTISAESNFASQKNHSSLYINNIMAKSTDTLSEEFEKNISPLHETGLGQPRRKYLSQMVSEKKEYWDDEIELILEKKDDKKLQSRKKSSNLRRNDSLSKKRNRQIVNRIPSMAEKWKQSFEINVPTASPMLDPEPQPYQGSLVSRWKHYWNEKVEKCKSPENLISNLNKLRIISPSPDLLVIESSPKRSFNSRFNNCQTKHNNEDNITSQSDDFCEKNYFNYTNPNILLHFKEDINNENNNTSYFNRYDLDNASKIMYEHVPMSFIKSLSPIVDCEESRNSTPESIFGGIVSKRINNFNSSTKIIKKETIKSEETIDPMKSTLQKQGCLETNFPVIESPKKDCKYNSSKSCIKTEFNKSKNEIVNESLTNFESEVELKSDKIENDILPVVGGIKEKIKIIDKMAINNARESFLKNKSKTIDIPKIKIVSRLKKYFSMETIKGSDTRNEKITFINKEIVDSGPKSLQETLNKNQIDDGKRFASFENDIGGSTDSIPSISERKARIENHLKHLQSRSLVLQTKAKDGTKEVKTDEFKTVNESQVNDQVKINQTIDNISQNKHVLTNSEIIDNVAIVCKPVGQIVAVFEKQKSITSKERTKHFDLIKPKKKQKDLYWSKANKENDSSIHLAPQDADNREGTNRTQNRDSPLSMMTRNNQDDEAKLIIKHQSLQSQALSQKSEDNMEDNDNKALIKEVDEIESSKYKERFRKAKMFFQTLDGLQKTHHTETINECERLLLGKSQENINKDDKIKEVEPLEEKSIEQTKRNQLRKIQVKAYSAPTSDTESESLKYEWKRGGSGRLLKISEKFFVEDFFNDVAGESNRTTVGMFKGIPHKQAVLAAFRSMENVSQQSSYEYTISQMEDFAKKNGIVNAQTYHSEYPHLPTTQPGKYRARYDIVASGLISRKDLLRVQLPRRNSAPGATNVKFNNISK